MTAERPTQIGGGIQYHHSHNLDCASVTAINTERWLAGVITVTDRPEHRELAERALALARDIGDATRAAQTRRAAFYAGDPQRFYAALHGEIPWPDEIAEGFEPICTCDRRCLYHVTAAPSATEADCNCGAVCPRHLIERMPGDRPEPITPLPAPPRPPSFREPSLN